MQTVDDLLVNSIYILHWSEESSWRYLGTFGEHEEETVINPDCIRRSQKEESGKKIISVEQSRCMADSW